MPKDNSNHGSVVHNPAADPLYGSQPSLGQSSEKDAFMEKAFEQAASQTEADVKRDTPVAPNRRP